MLGGESWVGEGSITVLGAASSVAIGTQDVFSSPVGVPALGWDSMAGVWSLSRFRATMMTSPKKATSRTIRPRRIRLERRSTLRTLPLHRPGVEKGIPLFADGLDRPHLAQAVGHPLAQSMGPAEGVGEV